MRLDQIHFPVFRLKNTPPIVTADGVVYYHSTVIKRNLDNNEETESTSIQLVDDTRINKPSVGLRRLIMKLRGATLLKITRSFNQIKDLVNSPSGYWYMDYTGKIFQYVKSRTEKLFCAKITKVIRPENATGCIIEVEGLVNRFKCEYSIKDGEEYAGILTFYGGYLLYGLYREPFKTTRRKV